MKLQYVLPGATIVTAGLAANSTLAPRTFQPLPLGSIKPAGWLKDQLTLMANGLAGHEHDFHDYVAHSSWLGGTQEYSDLHEGLPYWFNGLVPLAYALDDSRLLDQVHSAADYVLDHQAADGWLGPENGTLRNFWARMPLCLGLMQLAEADQGYEGKIAGALYKFAGLMNSMLRDNYTGYWFHEGDQVSEGDTQWGRVRVQDMLITLQWLYENHPAGNTTQLLENMQMLIDGSLNWENWYNEQTFIKQDLNTVSTDITVPLFPYEHGVNVGQGLKALAVFRRVTKNDTLIQSTRDAVNWTFTYHAGASGAILADERLAGLAPFYGSETCTLVETTYSLTYLYQALGDNDFADKAERVAFNALPVQLTPDWWARQYVSSPNQPYAKHLEETPFWNVNQWGQTYGLETDYPCCTVNHPQGYPKFLSASFVKVGDNGLAHVLLAPGTASTTLKSGNVTVAANTNYPFSDLIMYTITASSPFDFYIRVPTWASVTNSTIKLGSTTSPLTPDPQTGLHKIPITSGTTYLNYTIGVPGITTTPRANDTVAIYHGALLYALTLPSSNTSTLPKSYTSNTEYPSSYAPPQSRDYQLTNTSAWNIAIDPSTLTLHGADDTARLTLNNPIWSPGAPPNWMSAKACEIEWGMYEGVPAAPPGKGERKCVGSVFEARLEPLGAAKLHLVDLPVVDLGMGGTNGSARMGG